MLSGHITICKVFTDGTQEVVLDKANMITAGMGSSFCDSLQGRGSQQEAFQLVSLAYLLLLIGKITEKTQMLKLLNNTERF